jgi:hypothetical protein
VPSGRYANGSRARAAKLGSVTAPDEKTAIERAAAKFKVRPELLDRLVARRVG